jgi:GNAT superfamily N-acetyltransferase
MKIRRATVLDTEWALNLGIQFLKEAQAHRIDEIDDEHLYLRAAEILDSGVVFIAENDNSERVGALACIVAPAVWFPEDELHELFWYVLPEHRGTSAGLRLLKAFIDYGKAHESVRKIILLRRDDSPLSKDAYSKRGFSPSKESSWFMEV